MVARSSRVRGVLAVMAIAAAGCSVTPTSPSPAATGVTVTAPSQQPPPVPPRDASFTPARALGATRFLAFGDSITYGVLSSSDGAFLFDAPSHSYTVRLQLGLNVYHSPQQFTVINEGNPGEAAASGANRLSGRLQAHSPQVLLLLHGINDLNAGRSVSQTGASLQQMLDIAALYSTPVIIATMFQTYESASSAGLTRDNSAALIPAFNAEIRRIASGRQNVTVVDLYAAFGSNRSLVGGDGLHPTEAGYEAMATAFLTAIETAFPVRGIFQ